MVACEATSLLAALSNSMALHHQQRNPTRMDNQPNFSTLRNYSGLDLEKKSRPPVEAEFFLDIHFLWNSLTGA